MDYKKHYDLLTQRGMIRKLFGYVELHHIIPRCMGGSDEKINLVELTPEEHFLAHQLLVKIYPNNRGLIYSLARLSGGKSSLRSNKLYGWIKRKISLQRSADMRGHEIWVGRKHKETTKDKIRIFNLENSRSRGLIRSVETKSKISDSKKNIPKPKIQCPHCGILAAAHLINRYHFNSCKKINKSNILP